MQQQFRLILQIKRGPVRPGPARPGGVGHSEAKQGKGKILRFVNEYPDWWASVVGLDIETTPSESPCPYKDRIVTIQIAFPDGDIYIWTEGFENLVGMLENPDILKICHNACFEYKFLKRYLGADLWPIYDTMLVEQILTSGLSLSASLAATAFRRVSALLDKSLQRSFTSSDLTEAQLQYVENDVKHLIPIREEQEKLIAEEGMEKIRDLECELVPVVAAMELAGIKLDPVAWDKVVEVEARLMEEAAEVFCQNLVMPAHTFALFGNVSPINLNSRQQVLDVFHKSGIKVPNTKEGTLTKYMKKHPDCVGIKAYQNYVKHAKRMSWDYPKHINLATGRIHTNYHQIGARSGRFSSSRPNLQNVERENRVRGAFVPEEGHVFIGADYDQQEMRVMAEASGDKNLQKVCLEDDPHLANARVIWNDPHLQELSGQKRIIIKNTGFAMNYGAGAETFANSSGIDIEEAEYVLAKLKRTYPKVHAWGRAQRKFLQEWGFVSTLWNRKRWFPGAKENPNQYPNEPINTPIQGSSADMIKRAMVRIHKVLDIYDARILLQVHDELIIECKEEQALEVAEIVEQEMAAAGAEMIKSVPCPAEAKIMKCWAK